ncbi:calcium/proton exchanger [Gemmatimonadetes bacterium T265]|nr:calcium/proton exchanger [Gemmatimonadetes bacterium T265]
MASLSLQFTRSERAWLGAALAAAVLAGTLAAVEAPPIARFVVAAAALALLARAVGTATEQLGERLSAGATGVLQGAFGNLPELFVSLFSLKAGLRDVVRAALVGSILANAVLVLGLALLVGGLKHGTQRFDSQPPRSAATLMLLAVTALAVPTLADTLHTPAQPHESALSATCAVVLLVVFAASLRFTLAADPSVLPPAPGTLDDFEGVVASADAPHGWSVPQSVGVLATAGLGAALVSDWFVDALLPATRSLGLSQTFTGLVVVAIAGNAVENAVGISLAAKNKPDYALSVILNSALQVALALTPVLVLASFFIGPAPLTLVLPPILLAALTLGTLVAAFVVYDGESIWLEGVALVGLYVMFAASVWWG